jgi:hypothetical protein
MMGCGGVSVGGTAGSGRSTGSSCSRDTVVETAVTDDGTRAVAVDGECVYWTTWGTAWPGGKGEVAKAPLQGGAPTVLVTGLPTPYAIALDDAFVYFTDGEDGTVNKVPKSGGAVTTLAATGLPGATAIAVDRDAVYWNPGGRAVARVSKNGGAPSILASDQAVPAAIAVDDTSVYWVNEGTAAQGGEAPLSLLRANKEGGPATTLASGEVFDPLYRTGDGSAEQTWSLASNATSLVWASYGTGTIVRFDKSTGQATTLASGLGAPHSIAVDARWVYWTDGGYASDPTPPEIARMPLAGGAPVFFATGPTTNGVGTSSALAIALSATGAYFSTGYGQPGDVRELVLCDP